MYLTNPSNTNYLVTLSTLYPEKREHIPTMKKKNAIRLLELQIEKINDKEISREHWVESSTTVLQRIFPISSSSKVAQIQTINKTHQDNVDITGKDKIDIRKRQAERYMRNYIEEIELLDMENHNGTIEGFINSFIFWAILISVMLISFIGGTLLNIL